MGFKSCVSLRSAVFFGASIHIFLAAIQVFFFLMQLTLFLKYSKRPEQASLTLVSFFVLLLGAIFLPLGCLIFRGVDKEKLNLIKYPMWAFLLCKIVEISLKLYQEAALVNPRRRVDAEQKIYHAIDITASIIYVLLLFFYQRRLHRQKEEDDLSIRKGGREGFKLNCFK